MTMELIAQEVRTEISGIVEAAKALQVVDHHALVFADQEFNRIREKKKIILSKLDPIRDGFEQEKKKVIAVIKELTAPCDQATEIYEAKILTYKAWVKKKEEEERNRLQALKDQQAKEAKQKEAEELLRLAETVEKGGDPEQAAALMEEAIKIESKPVQSVHVEIAPTLPKLQSVEKQTYHAEVVDLEALIKAVFEGKVPRAAIKIEANMTYLNNRAKMEEASLNIPGVESKPKDTLAKGRSKPATDIFGSNNGAAKGTAVVPLF
ncbi:hypothetical protein [Candidatus Manganitrophus noduliformans]|uniref:Uncharacterized protein n=1 Tax=Candidatus Manganitrophus noduliformans TaxID=2606439 RepID=A0A7X6IA01_9BACT|nr:hypothetical protein [Candidatus Manganitrophus noduliformans]NKE69849.1 hypothetical protein [Candidatus Manganitrophus noduliformans]